MGDQTIYFHIGGGKCGSSAIQTSMALNAEAIGEQGVIVPLQGFVEGGVVSGEQIRYFEGLFNGGGDLTEFSRAVDRYFDAAPDARALILSGENLSNPYVDPTLLTGLADRYRVEIVLYIRRQDEYFASAWQQWGVKEHPDLWSFVLSEVPWRVNWQSIIESWMRLVPAEQIQVRLFESAELVDGDVIADFYSTIGVVPSGFAVSQELINPTFNLGVGYLTSAVASTFDSANDNSVFQMVRTLTGDRHVKRRSDRLFSAAQQRAIVAHYEASNRWVKNLFFADLERAELFAPIPDGEASGADYVRRQADAAMFDLIIELFRRSEQR